MEIDCVARPMKGTARRGLTIDQDEEYALTLRNSDKDRAENLMILDMIRNDMGKIAEPGTVEVPALFQVETHPTVLQMTSTVECRTVAGFSDIVTALFPCASVTGAPKVRTMQIINRLEGDPEGCTPAPWGTCCRTACPIQRRDSDGGDRSRCRICRVRGRERCCVGLGSR